MGLHVKSVTRAGTQSIDRTLRLLKLIASARGERGWRLSDLAEHCGLQRSTAHRLLTFLTRERLVVRRPIDRHYLPGPLLFELSLTMTSLSSFVAASQPTVDRLARRTGGMAHLLLRSDAEFVCAVRAGTSTIKAPSIEVGTRRPLLVAAGGIAMLASMEEPLADNIIARNVKEVAGYGSRRLRLLKQLVHDSRKRGFCVVQGEFVTGIHAIGVAVVDSSQIPIASLSTVAPADLFPPSRILQIADWLKTSAIQLGLHAERSGLVTEVGLDSAS